MPNFLLAIAFCGFVFSSAGDDTLPANGTLSNGQTLISRNRDFELGFFSPGSSKNRFLGIWYTKKPDVVVWVANRNDPVIDSRGVMMINLQVTRNGALVISRDGSIQWSSNSSRVAARNPSLRLLDTGNLVLADTAVEADSLEGNYIWQSFDYPSDTRLPGMYMVQSLDAGQDKYLTSWRSSDDPSPGDFTYRIENKGLPQMVIMRGGVKIYRSGMWNGVYINVPTFYNNVFKGQMVIDEGGTTYVDPYNGSILTRLVLDQSGSIRRYTMNDGRDDWNLVYTIPKDPCDDYAKCGPNGMCRIESVPICGCLDGFEPKFRTNWDFQDWSDGCTRIRPLSCRSGDGFLELKGVKYPDMLRFWLNTSMNIGECRDTCLRKCNCTAYAQPYINNGGHGCLMWFGDLIDTRVLPGADTNQNIYIRLPVSELESIRNSNNKKARHAKAIAISVAMGVLIPILTCGVIVIVLVRRRKRREGRSEDIELPLFSFATIAAATHNFSEESMIGEGGFGPVYKGKLPAGEEIAVKRLSGTSRQGLEEFMNEVILFAKLQHTNLVRLLGCCIKGDERMLIYEYLQNRSLDYLIFDQNRKTELTWPKRYSIILGIARGLLYLHQDSRLKIIHRDLKTSNILLDENLNPKISDFGLARTFRSDQFMARTRRVVGTYGYMAPEYAIDGKFSEKSDVFSFGVMILEIVSGKRNRGFHHHDHDHSLLGHAWLLWKENKVLELMDECLKDTFVEPHVKRCVQVGLLCVQKLAEDRPAMSSVVFMLGCEGEAAPEPNEPGFFMERSSNDVENQISSRKGSVTITMTELEGR
ncbi:G-type lectin S-receptor-like serine/threonine-protein kinase At4g27290 isoform X1 [Salvia miltiorrhiza]|uniref:G-type lectin S-receptor-like serine/threonine-protein kinase At4g27290 isoform X1 n=1 Tax=Salvia miltiorrhiza TaxID=226208 RepID=UPI0025AB6214|nr:G-type lectin S-receptor-like serine/threonine-protein kinase At4g27290 isoform X1 [Salvia miltiorrhiza]